MKFSCDFYSNQMAIGNAFNFVKTVLALKLYVRNISEDCLRLDSKEQLSQSTVLNNNHLLLLLNANRQQ